MAGWLSRLRSVSGSEAQRPKSRPQKRAIPRPENVALADTRCVAYFKANQYPTVTLGFDELILRGPSNPDYPYHLGLIEKESGSTSEAIGHLQTALTLKLKFPDSTTARDLIDELKKKQAR